jgi:hypothetical protein
VVHVDLLGHDRLRATLFEAAHTYTRETRWAPTDTTSLVQATTWLDT